MAVLPVSTKATSGAYLRGIGRSTHTDVRLDSWLDRFDHSGETFGEANTVFPEFLKNAEWYPLYLFPGRNQKTQISPAAHSKAVKATLELANIHSKKVTHIFRGSASRMADLGGAAESDINRAGRWDSSAMTQYYLTTMPRMTMRVLAGFAPNRGTFWLARDVDPPEAL